MKTRSDLRITNYQVLFSHEQHAASAISAVRKADRVVLTLFRASDGERGVATLLTESRDDAGTWSDPRPFGPPLKDPKAEFQGVSLAHILPDGEVLATGIHLPKGYDLSGGHNLYRPGEILIGRADPERLDFTWTRIPSGEFMEEQFIAPGIQLADGRLVMTLWGSATRDDNWQCGVLLSDDGGRTLRYRQVGYEPDKAIRDRADVVAGFNEQTLFELPDGRLVSIIRARAKLGGIAGVNPHSSECLFFRSISTDRGENWSPPEASNLPGTGAPSDGLVLPDGSLILPARIPSTWSRHQGNDLCGLSISRSFDCGLTWATELVLTRTPKGELFDNYYNAMNGTFLARGPGETDYLFGHNRPKTNAGMPAYALRLAWEMR